MRNTNTLEQYDPRNPNAFFELQRAQRENSGPYQLILTQNTADTRCSTWLSSLRVPSTFKLIIVPPNALLKTGEDMLSINGNDKTELQRQGVPFVPPHSKCVIAIQVAITFGVIMPLMSHATPLVSVGMIASMCFMANMLLAPCLDGSRYPMELYLNKLNAMGVSLLVGISMFSFLIESNFIIRSAGVGAAVALCVSVNAHISCIERSIQSNRCEINSMKKIGMTFAAISSEVFCVVAVLYAISQRLGDTSAVAITAKIFSAMLIIQQASNVSSRACKVIGSLLHRPGQENDLNDQPQPDSIAPESGLSVDHVRFGFFCTG